MNTFNFLIHICFSMKSRNMGHTGHVWAEIWKHVVYFHVDWNENPTGSIDFPRPTAKWGRSYHTTMFDRLPVLWPRHWAGEDASNATGPSWQTWHRQCTLARHATVKYWKHSKAGQQVKAEFCCVLLLFYHWLILFSLLWIIPFIPPSVCLWLLEVWCIHSTYLWTWKNLAHMSFVFVFCLCFTDRGCTIYLGS